MIANPPDTPMPDSPDVSLPELYRFEPQRDMPALTANKTASFLAEYLSPVPVITCSPEPAVWKSSQSIANNKATIVGLSETRRLTGK